MTLSEDFKISWVAPIVPLTSLAGIPLHVNVELLCEVLGNYLIDKDKLLYKFDESPVLFLKSYGLDEKGDGGYSFSVFHEEIVPNVLKGIPALSIVVRGWRVYAVKVYDFSFSEHPAKEFIYKGTLQEGIGLGSLVSDLLSFTDLDFDEAEEWFYTDDSYGAIEITGWAVPLEDEPDQIITAICVIPGANC